MSLDVGFRREGCSRRAWGCPGEPGIPCEEPKLRDGTGCSRRSGLRVHRPVERGQQALDAVLRPVEPKELVLAPCSAKEPPPEHRNA